MGRAALTPLLDRFMQAVLYEFLPVIPNQPAVAIERARFIFVQLAISMGEHSMK